MQFQLPVAVDASVQALEEVFRHTPVGVVLTDLHGTILDANLAFCTMIGRARGELLGRAFTAFIHPEEIDHASGSMGRLREEEVESIEHLRRWLTSDGRTLTTKLTASVVRAQDGEPICGIAFIEDIGARLQIEQALRESEGRYRRVVEDQTEMIVRCTPDGVRTFVNEAYSRYAGVPIAELLGKSFFPLIPEEEREAVYQKYKSMTPEAPVWTEEHRAIAGDGSVRWHRWTDRGIFDAAGNLLEIQAVGRDITDEREAQERLRRSEESYRELYDAMPVAVWESDFSAVLVELRRRGIDTPEKLIAAAEQDRRIFFECGRHSRIVTANAAALKMIGSSSAGDLPDWLRARYTDEAVLTYVRATAPVFLGDATVVDMELSLRTPEGQRFDLMQRFARKTGWSTEPRAVAIVLDVTEQRKIEEAAQREREALTRADKMISLGVLVSGVAHEINNPNHSIMLNMSLLRDAWRGIMPIVDEHAAREGETRIANLPWDELRGEVASLIEDVELATERIRGIVSELRSFALDPDPHERRAVSMNDVVRSSLRLLGNHVRKATTRFSVSLAPGLPDVLGNARRLEQIVVNLVINACQALESTDRAIAIETGKTHTHVFVRVVDEGRGISPDDLRRITEPFFTTKRTAGGTGLGLAVSDRIVQEHGGALTFESELGKGTTVTLAIPFEG